jgi:hypothetical protein
VTKSEPWDNNQACWRTWEKMLSRYARFSHYILSNKTMLIFSISCHHTSTAAGLMASEISMKMLSIYPLCRPLYFQIPWQWILHLRWPILLVLAIHRVAIVGHMLRLKHPAQHSICFSSPRITLGLGNENTTIPLYTTFSSLLSFLIVCTLCAIFSVCVCVHNFAVRAWKLCMHVILLSCIWTTISTKKIDFYYEAESMWRWVVTDCPLSQVSMFCTKALSHCAEPSR